MEKIKFINQYIKFMFNAFIVIYISFYAINALSNFINGIMNIDNTSDNTFLMIYLISLFLSVTIYLAYSFKVKKLNLLPLTIILILINIFY